QAEDGIRDATVTGVQTCALPIVDEARPDIERVDQLPIEPLEAPGLVGANDEIGISFQEAVIEVDDTADEFRREDAHAAVVQEIDAGGSAGHIEHGVIAEMRIAVDHAEAAERPPPGREHRGAEPVAGGEVSLG